MTEPAYPPWADDVVLCQRLHDGRVRVLHAPERATFARELLDGADPNRLVWADGRITILGVDGDVTYEVTGEVGRFVYGRLVVAPGRAT